MKEVDETVKDITLSHSSSNLLRSCEQKYVHYKVRGTDPDEDANQNMDNFNVGKAVHFILEESLHQFDEKEFYRLLDLACTHFEVEHERGLVAALAFRLFKVHKGEGLHTVHCEYKILTDVVLGFVDLIACDDEKNWWIIDIKTAAKLYDFTTAKLHNDYQLNLYAAHIKLIAKDLDLDPEKFMGCRYRVATKSKAKLRPGENVISYIKRTEKTIGAYEIIIPKDRMDPSHVLSEHKALWRRAKQLHKKGAKPKKDFANCSAYFRPCEYWSQCHGDNFTNTKTEFEINEY